ncbi:MAG TPA: formylmethanofuran dehydrogenase subunit C [Methylotenera sp.]|nr:formylmethanofuran dehydrogenase subunit C [Methylotenera sp.]
MTALIFTLKKTLQHALNCAALTPSNLADKSAAEIADTLLQYGKSKLRTDEVFDITGDNTQHIVFKNTNNKLEYLGANMSTGAITIEGDAGAYLGFGMKSGTIHCKGNTEAFAACNMAGGLLKIDGNTADFLGGASAGLRKGMRGGTVIVKGNAGDRVGDQMRRGLILIEGNAADYCGSRMIAGTIGIYGNVGQYAGFNMQRGTLLLTQAPQLHATLQNCGTLTLPFLSLLYPSLKQYETSFNKITSQRVQRFVGDAAVNGNGEILVIST